MVPVATGKQPPERRSSRRTKTVVVTQPYFYPYAGYFRLLLAADEFVIFDCVQFPRRGRVHRCEVPGPSGALEWLTLPIARHSRDIRICDLRFQDGARATFDQRLRRLSWVASARGAAADEIREHLHAPLTNLVDYLEQGLALVASLLGLGCRISRSSTLQIDPALRSQERVIAVCKAVGATHYVNAPSGRSLYDPAAFAAEGLELSFLSAYQGPFFQLLPALMTQDPTAIAEDVREQSQLEPT